MCSAEVSVCAPAPRAQASLAPVMHSNPYQRRYKQPQQLRVEYSQQLTNNLFRVTLVVTKEETAIRALLCSHAVGKRTANKEHHVEDLDENFTRNGRCGVFDVQGQGSISTGPYWALQSVRCIPGGYSRVLENFINPPLWSRTGDRTTKTFTTFHLELLHCAFF